MRSRRSGDKKRCRTQARSGTPRNRQRLEIRRRPRSRRPPAPPVPQSARTPGNAGTLLACPPHPLRRRPLLWRKPTRVGQGSPAPDRGKPETPEAAAAASPAGAAPAPGVLELSEPAPSGSRTLGAGASGSRADRTARRASIHAGGPPRTAVSAHRRVDRAGGDVRRRARRAVLADRRPQSHSLDGTGAAEATERRRSVADCLRRGTHRQRGACCRRRRLHLKRRHLRPPHAPTDVAPPAAQPPSLASGTTATLRPRSRRLRPPRRRRPPPKPRVLPRPPPPRGRSRSWRSSKQARRRPRRRRAADTRCRVAGGADTGTAVAENRSGRSAPAPQPQEPAPPQSPPSEIATNVDHPVPAAQPEFAAAVEPAAGHDPPAAQSSRPPRQSSRSRPRLPLPAVDTADHRTKPECCARARRRTGRR